MAHTTCCRASTGSPGSPYSGPAPSISGRPCAAPGCPLGEVLAQMPEEVRAVHLRACEAAEKAGHDARVVRARVVAVHYSTPDLVPHWVIGTNFEGAAVMCWYDKVDQGHAAPGWYFRSHYEPTDTPLDGTPAANAEVMFG